MPSRKIPKEPRPSRPRIPEYGIPKTPRGMLPLSFVDERMTSAKSYWVATTRPDGRPHARPGDGIWVAGVLSFGGSPKVRWVRNLESNPHVSVHLDSGQEVVQTGAPSPRGARKVWAVSGRSSTFPSPRRSGGV